MRIAKETWLICFLGIADLITTILFIRQNGGQEANPLFRQYWEMGTCAFVAAKLVMLAGPLCILEWARRRNPQFVSWALRGVIVGYLTMYGIGYCRLNGPSAYADELKRVSVTPTPLLSHYREVLTYQRHRWIMSRRQYCSTHPGAAPISVRQLELMREHIDH